ncbi:receptor-like protein kinase HAIKU2 [Cucurbita pepo subsp. pepo]|uniref:receptor-like protein kinase HAIKU2 n=1 Tax=Cucurbita pepo subsp. pepo TaxID=3664 RepID=UPI000C9D753A|nr:receptor-like protein kinase HAIKU2 [Cucurbita pepo subsp. pepo]
MSNSLNPPPLPAGKHSGRPPSLVGLRHFLLLLLLLLCSLSLSHGDELQPLLDLKSALHNNSTSMVLSSWVRGKDVCSSFHGIVCDSNGFVVEINLSAHNLSGILPFHSICSLQSLEKLSFGGNFLYGTVSNALRNCSMLKYLDLGQNFFTGEVPDLSSLERLRFLNLNNSGFSGDFPWKSLLNLTDLEFLSLGDNSFNPTTSFPSEIIELNKLYWLYLSNCSIHGEIPPGIGNLSLLENLELSQNELTGEIPSQIVNLKSLWQLELHENSLTGKLPTGFGNLTGLRKFDASTNNLEGDLMELRFLTNLESLQLFQNRFSGTIPEEFGDFKELVELSLYQNKLTGSLPQRIGSWAAFLFIDVSENFLSGPIPPDMCKQGSMTDLLMLQNNFSGGIPESYMNCKSLQRFRVNNNSLSGVVPAGIWSLPNLSIVDLSMNQFDGLVTSDIGKAKALAQLFLSNNRFSGKLPAELGEVSSLVSIQIDLNQFVGPIPESLGKLKVLDSLSLNNNKFSDNIPSSLGSCSSLSTIDLSMNSFSGHIPENLGYLPILNSLNLSNNELSGEIPTSFSQLKLSSFDLSNNRLSGQVPESLAIQAFEESFMRNPGLCSESIRHLSSCSSTSRSSSHIRSLLSCTIAGILVLLLMSFLCLLFVKSKRNNAKHLLKSRSWDMKPFHIVCFTEKEIIDSINSHNLIGRGGSGNVYKVVLSNGKELAVKHIWQSSSIDQTNCQTSATILTKRKIRSSEYDAEVATLSSVRHVNVVKLYCSISSEDSNLLVYEYLPNGSLWDQLHTSRKIEMGWQIRYEVAVGAARGLEYLHHGCDRPVIHRDVKSSNILLDSDWKPRIADFGLAKILQDACGGGDSSHVIAGTLGYIAPEYAYTCKINEKSDVYSFGVVLMELVTGRKPNEPEFGENKDIVQWAHSRMRDLKGNLKDMVDPSISEVQVEDAIKVLRIALRCTAKTPSTRPSMRMVVHMLEEAEPCNFIDIVVKKECAK